MNEVPTDSLSFLNLLDAHGVKGFERYKQWKRFLARKAWEQGVPISGQFELTPLCNLDCKMCYVHLSDLKGERLLRAKDWIPLMDQAVEAGMISAGLTGGECLTHPDFREIYLHLKELGVEVSVLTNGTLIDEETADFFAAHRPRLIQISLYGSSEEAYERVTGHRCFQRTVEAIERVKARSIPLHLAITPCREMLGDMEALVKLAKSLHHDYHVNSGLFPARDETGRKLEDFSITVREQVACIRMRAVAEGMTLYPGQSADGVVTGLDAARKGLQPQAGAVTEGSETVDRLLTDHELRSEHVGKASENGIACGSGRFAFNVDWRGVMKGCTNIQGFAAYPMQTSFAQSWKTLNEWSCVYPKPVECVSCACRVFCNLCVAEHQINALPGHSSEDCCEWVCECIRQGVVKKLYQTT